MDAIVLLFEHLGLWPWIIALVVSFIAALFVYAPSAAEAIDAGATAGPIPIALFAPVGCGTVSGVVAGLIKVSNSGSKVGQGVMEIVVFVVAAGLTCAVVSAVGMIGAVWLYRGKGSHR
jgi:hypothetical protein